jgi:hypothetical protein
VAPDQDQEKPEVRGQGFRQLAPEGITGHGRPA